MKFFLRILFICAALLVVHAGMSSCTVKGASTSGDEVQENVGDPDDLDDGADPDPDDGDDEEEADDEDIGTSIGEFTWTYYWVEFESDYAGNKDGTIYFEDGSSVVARQEFVDKVKVEGTGYLDDGSATMINLGEDCVFDPDGKCFFVVNTDLYPYGVGAYDNPLQPWRTVAVDIAAHDDIEYDAVLYIAELDGAELPAIDAEVFDPADAGFLWDDSCGCYVHDGCVVVEDSGVSGLHLDFFALSEDAYWDIGAAIDWADPVHVYVDSPLCD